MRVRFVAISMLALVALPCAATEDNTTCPPLMPTPEALSKQLQEANDAFEAGEQSKAATKWKEIRECAPGAPEWPKAVYNLGLLEYRRKDFPQAITYFEEVLQSHPDDEEPGGSLMETNRNYSNRSAVAISQCYEEMGRFGAAWRYAWLAKTKYRYYSWCGTCYNNANSAINRRIAYLAVRTSCVYFIAAILVLGFVTIKWKRRTNPDTAARS